MLHPFDVPSNIVFYNENKQAKKQKKQKQKHDRQLDFLSLSHFDDTLIRMSLEVKQFSFLFLRQ